MRKRHAALLTLFAAVLLYSLFTQDQTKGSTFSPRPDGAMAFKLLLQEMGFRVEQWRRPLRELSSKNDGTLFIISPVRGLGGLNALFQWIDRGNRLVYIGPLSGEMRNKIVGSDSGDEAGTAYGFVDLMGSTHPDKPIKIACPPAMAECHRVMQVSQLSGGPKEPVERADILTRQSGRSTILRMPSGEGEIWYIADPAIVSNEHIDKFDNLRLLYQIAGGGRRMRPDQSNLVLFDEFHHGLAAPPEGGTRVKQETVYLFAAVLIIACSAAALSQAARLGPALPHTGDQPPRAVECASALGLLYCEHEASEVLRFYLGSWEKRVACRTGVSDRLSVEAFVEELARLGTVSPDNAADLRSAAAALCTPGAPPKVLQEHIDKLEQTAKRV